MALKYFQKVRSREEARARYHELAKRYHPDTASKGIRDPAAIFRQVQAEYEQVCRYFDVADMLGVTLPAVPVTPSQPEAKPNKEPRRADRTTRRRQGERAAESRITRRSVTAHSSHGPKSFQ